MAVTMAEISKLRTMTGAGIMDCKKALTEAENDFEKAIEIIRIKGKAVAEKRSEREASEGCVLAGVNEGFAAVLALKCETDFVAKNADFMAFTQLILNVALKEQPTTLDELKNLTIDGRLIKDLIIERTGIIGEKIELDFYEHVKDAFAISYIHMGNKLATIVSFNKKAEYQMARDIAMQAAAMNPVALDRGSVPESVIATELEVGRNKAREEGKPENMLDKIAQGRLNKFYKESTLLEQEFIKDAKINIQQYLASEDKELKITDFKRVTLNQD
jgi:elongation factor Ts